MPLRSNLKDILKGKVVIVGMGNPLRADDALGLVFVETLERMKPGCVLINAASTPESYAGKIIKEGPDTVLLVDAVHIEGAPGDWAVLGRDEMLTTGFTTHDLSPKLFLDYLNAHTKAAVYLLGIQPATLAFGGEMSEPVKVAIERLAQAVAQTIKEA